MAKRETCLQQICYAKNIKVTGLLFRHFLEKLLVSLQHIYKQNFYMNFQPEIPQGKTREDIQQREKIIKDFYAMWNAANPTKHVFNIALNDFIHVRFLSIQETVEHAAFTYKSTLAVTYLTEILEKAGSAGKPCV